MTKRRYVFTSESVTEGHPDKVCDMISDGILDAALTQDPESRVAIESVVKTGFAMVVGEMTTKGYIDMQKVVRETLTKIGYCTPDTGFDSNTCGVLVSISEQSADISQGVTETEEKEQGAGDQGMMFGYATNETPEYMPLPIVLAHKLTKKLTELRKTGALTYLRPDGKSQVTIEYEDGKPLHATAVVVSTHHSEDVTLEQIRADIIEKLIKPVCGEWLREDTKFFVNPTGRFVIGGPVADSGLTGRKIIVDTYGGHGAHGGGAFSGKDSSKVDRSGAYAARYIAKNIVAAGLADKCEVQIAYAIGVAEPVSVLVHTHKTNNVPEEEISELVRKHFPLKPGEIVSHLKLKRPIFQKTAAYGHFGRDDPDFTWEALDKVDALKQDSSLNGSESELEGEDVPLDGI